MSKPFQVYILAADRVFYEGPCESLIVPTTEGQYGILADHSSMIGAISAGVLQYRIPGEQAKTAAVSAGLIKIENNEVLILADTAERPEEIDENRARRAEDKAREEILQRRSIREYRSAQAGLARAINRLRVKREYTDK